MNKKKSPYPVLVSGWGHSGWPDFAISGRSAMLGIFFEYDTRALRLVRAEVRTPGAADLFTYFRVELGDISVDILLRHVRGQIINCCAGRWRERGGSPWLR